MAAIVAQITKANWERKQNRKHYVNTEKCVYFIPPFDDRFDPLKHNVYIKRKALYESQHTKDEAVKDMQRKVQERLKLMEEERMRNEPKANKIGKAVLGFVVILLPTLLFLFLFMTFYYLETDDQHA